jgi:hypothetical protein
MLRPVILPMQDESKNRENNDHEGRPKPQDQILHSVLHILELPTRNQVYHESEHQSKRTETHEVRDRWVRWYLPEPDTNIGSDERTQKNAG